MLLGQDQYEGRDVSGDAVGGLAVVIVTVALEPLLTLCVFNVSGWEERDPRPNVPKSFSFLNLR